MPDFIDRIPFFDRTRWMMLQACASDGVNLKTFSRDIGMSERRIRDLLFAEKSDVGNLDLREVAEWFYCSIGRVPEFAIVPRGPWHSHERPV
jgi:hypothetical protein